MKKTEKESEEFKKIELALRKMSDLADYINERKRIAVNNAKLLEISAKVKGLSLVRILCFF